MSPTDPLLPGATIGILGGGQLGRMLALAARPMGYHTAVLCPEPNCPASHVADIHIEADYQDPDAINRLAELADVATVEFENIPAETLQAVAAKLPLRPSWQAIHICQNREREKAWLRKNNFPLPDAQVVDSPESLAAAAASIGTPCVLKTAAFGYDGKGQQKIESPDFDPQITWDKLAAPKGVVEQWVSFEREISVICARSTNGEIAIYDPADNVHTNHILDTSTLPSTAPEKTLDAARALASDILGAFEYVGVLGVELFVTTAGDLLVNELAPRTHNSGHHTIDACATSQFEQQLRAICGLPLGSTALLAPCTMKNLLGETWLDAPDGNPDWHSLLAKNPASHLHLYGKTEPKHARKMGHFTTLNPK